MRKTTVAGLIGLLFSSPILAAETNINAKDVIVTASRTPQQKNNVIADVTVISQEEIERAGQSTLTELLQGQPGIEIGASGGAGTISSIFMRGASSNQIVVLIDGVRVNSITDGATYFGNIPLSQIQRIEILRGPASSLYGQDAVGGVIQLFTKKIEGRPRFNAAVGYGSYNTQTAEAGVGGSYNGLNYSLNASSKNTDGFSALKSNSILMSDRDGYRNLAASGQISYDLNERNQVGIQFFNSNGSVHFDNKYDVALFDTNAKLNQSSVSLFTKNQIAGFWKSTLRLSTGIDKNDSYFSWGSINIKSTQDQYSWQNDFSLPIGTITAALDRLEQKINDKGSSYSDYDSAKNRNSNGLYFGYVANIENHTFQVSLRSDNSSQYGTHVTRGLGYGYQLNNRWRAMASYGTAFKAPTFMDLYYGAPYYNNPDLKPERSENLEATVKYMGKDQTASVTVYHNNIKDFIALDSGNIPQNYNATIQGLTVSGSQGWNNFILKGSADIQSPRNTDNHNLLARRANRHGSLYLSRGWGDWLFDAELIASSARYNDPDNTQKMAGYALVNFVANYKINNDWNIQGRVNNLLDKEYRLTLDGAIPYSTPGANVFLSLRYTPNF
jgi:vitamin B12 transporter